MTQRQVRWHNLVRSLFITGAILVLPQVAIVQGTGVANAQLRPIADDTLGTERSIVTPFNPAIDVINGGTQRGANLFHSFREFNIDNGQGVYFTNPAGVTNILTRVTGGNPSQILGTLGVLGNANLFLLNPNGILFGANARLDFRGGSFLASTANSVVFGNGFAFSATNPQAPPLLTVNVPIGLQYGNNPGAIQVQGSFLQVPDGQTLTLTGGAVNVDGAGLFALGGRVELAGVGDAGVVGLTQQGQEWRLSVPDGLARADVAISNGAFVNVSSGGGGSIAITARNFTGTGASTGLRAGIAADSGTVGAQAGDIDINTTESMNFDASIVENIVASNGTGNAGDINITTGTLSLSNGAYLDTTTYGQGNAGNINITASDVVSFDGLGTGAYSEVQFGVVGQGGEINITTGTLSTTNGAGLTASTYGQGNGGNITIMARDAVSIDGVDIDGANGGIYNVVASGATGQGGNVHITTGNLFLTNGGYINASTYGQGNGGDITIMARGAVSVDGEGSNGFGSSILSIVYYEATGQAGDIIITADSISFTNGGTVGNITLGQGDAGDLTLTARDVVSFDGTTRNARQTSGAGSSVDVGAIGRGGNISISTGILSITNLPCTHKSNLD